MTELSKTSLNPQSNNDRPIELVSKSANVADMMIDWRDKFLDILSGTQAGPVLNGAGKGIRIEAGMDPAADLKRALDAFKVAAWDDPGSRVDYASLRTSRVYKVAFKDCSAILGAFDPESLASREDKLAFWINLYNALVIDAVIALGVKQSVGEGRFGLLSFFRRAAYNVGGMRLSLDDIEHGILRGNRGHPFIPGVQFASQDPRQKWVIHPTEVRIQFAINCASRSCPPIQIFQGANLDAQLALATRNFIKSSVKIDPDNMSLTLSSIFKWFEADFGGREEVLKFIVEQLHHDERREWISENFAKLRLQYGKYDWSLNS